MSVMKSRHLYILIEESFRELRSRLLITQAALAEGFKVVLGQQWWFAANFANLPRGTVLFKGNNSVQTNVMRNAKAAGHKVASIEEEIFGLCDAEAILPWFDPRAENLCDMFLMQGDLHANMLAQHFPNSRAKIVTVGNPRADVLRLARHSGINGEAANFVRKHGEFILINTNYGEVNPYDFDTYAFYLRCLKVGVLNPDNATQMELFHTACQWEAQNLREMILFIQAMSIRHPKVPIVLRPHPSENLKTWRRSMRDYQSVHLVTDDDHVPWSLACASAVHTGSTTGIEAFLLGSRSVNICPGDSPWHDRYFAPVVNDVAKNASAAVDIVERHLSEDHSAEEESRRSTALQPYLDTESRPSSPAKIMRAIQSIAPMAHGSTIESRTFVTTPFSDRQQSKALLSADIVRDLMNEISPIAERQNIIINEIGPSVLMIVGKDSSR
jgi:surface carbohydrate biosynthesis protein